MTANIPGHLIFTLVDISRETYLHKKHQVI
jgi:hypothetical protein